MSVLYVTSELPVQGKTALCSSVASLLKEGGVKVKIVKVVSSTSSHHHALASYGNIFPMDQDIFSAVSISEASSSLGDLKKFSDLLLVEADSSIPADNQKTLVSEIDAEVIVVSDYANRSQCTDFSKSFGENLKGVIINFVPRFAGTNVSEYLIPQFESLDVAVIGFIPEDRYLLSLSVGQIAESLTGRFFSGEDLSDGLVQSFMVGGFGMDPGQYVFSTKSDKAVVIRGDRPDVQMSALQTDVTCFIMTNGIEPVEYIKYESQEERVPIIIVEKNTIETMEDIGNLQINAAFDRPDKLKRMSDLVDQYVGLERLTGIL